jgi:hypothetical protein
MLEKRAAIVLMSDRRAGEDGLLQPREWRQRLTGAWLAGLTRRTQFQDQIGSLLIESLTCFSGQGYCFALAAFENEKSAVLLQAYLDKWLPKLECDFDQDWAMPALAWVDRRRGTEFSKKYLQPGGLWEQFSAEQAKISGHEPWRWEVGLLRSTEEAAEQRRVCNGRAAEVVEGRRQAKGNPSVGNAYRPSSRVHATSVQRRIRRAASCWSYRHDPRQEPYAVVPHVRICGGGAG